MLNESLLWAKTIDPVSGRVVREETTLNSALVTIIFIAGVIGLFALFVHLGFL